jgi:hypothetical protein
MTLQEALKIIVGYLIIKDTNGKIILQDKEFKPHLYDVVKIEPISNDIVEVFVK